MCVSARTSFNQPVWEGVLCADCVGVTGWGKVQRDLKELIQFNNPPLLYNPLFLNTIYQNIAFQASAIWIVHYKSQIPHSLYQLARYLRMCCFLQGTYEEI